MTEISLHSYIGRLFPDEEGRSFGLSLVKAQITSEPVCFSDLTIDATKVAPGMLISGFFNSLFQILYNCNPLVFNEFKKVKWKFRFKFQEENFEIYLKNFLPYKNQKEKLLEELIQIERRPGMYFGADPTKNDLINYLLGYGAGGRVNIIGDYHDWAKLGPLGITAHKSFNDALNSVMDFLDTTKDIDFTHY